MALRAERSGASHLEKNLENGFAFLEFFECLSIQRPGSRSFVNRGVFSGDFFIIMAQRVGVVILIVEMGGNGV